jgi:hypothetical protein
MADEILNSDAIALHMNKLNTVLFCISQQLTVRWMAYCFSANYFFKKAYSCLEVCFVCSSVADLSPT